ncbi:conserved hypothetical protein [Rhodopseudomonas palustris HaA2]|uniref:DUF2218 domain-containing protein n=1 Tax=Rhodopseudomonas palustris (strain HaA2) TaxID=316058 RepID=Q2IRS0_RHOP2|nr:DUF2218 domain-containing protein [Rhodopseudomonas palustris]ABD09090.1 conserved hypothetical protein [Rhodopseudomonas palustris HaA2]
MNLQSDDITHTSRGTVNTAHASRYLQQLCKHWSHKFETEFDSVRGRIALPLGETRLTAEPESLVIDLTAADATGLATLQKVVVDHIERFAFRETLHFDWK